MAEPIEPPSGWTLPTIARYFTDIIAQLRNEVERENRFNKERFTAAEKAVTSALNAADKALQKAESASEKRFEGLNELRAMASDQTRLFLPRAEYDARHQALQDRVEDIGIRLATIETAQSTKKENVATSVGAIVAIVSVIYGVAATIGVVATLMLRH